MLRIHKYTSPEKELAERRKPQSHILRKLISLFFGRWSASAMDEIEKKKKEMSKVH